MLKQELRFFSYLGFFLLIFPINISIYNVKKNDLNI